MKAVKMLAVIMIGGLVTASRSTAQADTFVRSYSRRNGAFVQPHWRSNPDRTLLNNYGFPGNVNPHTGRVARGNVGTYLRRRLGGSRLR